MIPYLLMLFLHSPTFAASACIPYDPQKMKVGVCEDNFMLGRNADACLNEITIKISQSKPILDSANDKNKQNKSFEAAAGVFDKAIAEIDKLILAAEVTKLNIDSHLANIYLPEDYDKPDLIGMSTEEYLKSEPCYSTPRKVMTEDSQMVEILILDLKNKRNSLLAGKNTVKRKEGDLNSSNSNALITTSQKESSAQPKAVGKKGSGISGKITDGKSKKVEAQEKN